MDSPESDVWGWAWTGRGAGGGRWLAATDDELGGGACREEDGDEADDGEGEDAAWLMELLVSSVDDPILDESVVGETLVDDDWARDSDLECPTVAVEVPESDGGVALLTCDADNCSRGVLSPSAVACTCKFEEEV